MKKRIFAAVLATAMSLSLVACGEVQQAVDQAVAEVEQELQEEVAEEPVAEPEVEEPVVEEEPVASDEIIIGNPDEAAYTICAGIQTPKWSFRNAWDEANYGAATEYFNQITAWDADNNAYALPAEITDAYIVGDGKYQVSISGIEFPADEFADQENLNLIFLSSNIPADAGVEISNIVVDIDGAQPSIAPIVSPDSPDYLNMAIQNIWNGDIAEIGYYPTPFSNITITFDVTGTGL